MTANNKPKADPAIAAAKKRVSEAIKDIKTDVPGGVADLVKLCEALTGLKEVELKADDSGYGSALGGE